MSTEDLSAPAAGAVPGQPVAPNWAMPMQNTATAGMPAFGAPAAMAPNRPTAIKRRNVLAVYLGLPIITLGIYHLVWYYKIHKEMAATNPSAGINPTRVLLAYLFLSWTVVGAIISILHTADRIRQTRQSVGMSPEPETGMTWLGIFIASLWVVFSQSALNDMAPAA